MTQDPGCTKSIAHGNSVWLLDLQGYYFMLWDQINRYGDSNMNKIG